MKMKKDKAKEAVDLGAQFHNKYRPKTLDRVIGQEDLVKRLRGIIETKRIPSMMMFTGPASSGKTTLERAFVADLFDVKSIKHHSDYHEINGAADGNIDNIRSIMRMAKLRPRQAPRRVFMIDECHGLTGPSLEAVLKPMEEPSAHTLFILGTSEPEKLKNSLKTRGSQFALKPQSRENMLKYAKRIVKGESMDYMNAELLETVVENANGEMRTLCQILEAIVQSAGKDGSIKKEDIVKTLSTLETDDSKVAMNLLYEAYAGNMEGVYRSLLDVTDGYRMSTMLLNFNSFLINATVLKGEKHRSVWWNKNNKDLWDAVKEHKVSLHSLGVMQQKLIMARAAIGRWTVSEQHILGDAFFNAVSALTRKEKTKG